MKERKRMYAARELAGRLYVDTFTVEFGKNQVKLFMNLTGPARARPLALGCKQQMRLCDFNASLVRESKPEAVAALARKMRSEAAELEDTAANKRLRAAELEAMAATEGGAEIANGRTGT